MEPIIHFVSGMPRSGSTLLMKFIDRIEDETRQAISMTKIYTNILSNLMDAFASLISNKAKVVESSPAAKLNDREKEIIIAGGLLPNTKKHI